MTEEQAMEIYWQAIRMLEEVLESGHRSKQEIKDDLSLDDDDA